jgi:UPF0755 protein
MPTWRASNGRGAPSARWRRSRGDDGSGRKRIPGALRFLLFGGVLAAAVLITLLTALRPLVRAGVVGWAWDNPSAISKSVFVADFVREDLGDKLNQPAGTSADDGTFDVVPGDTIFTIAPKLQQAGFIADQHAFLFVAIESNLGDRLAAGTFVLRQNMTPAEVVDALSRTSVAPTTVPVTFREGIRLEQITAQLETITSGVDPKAFYQEAAHPTADLLKDYPWLAASGMPKGASLEGFLYPATYTLITAANGGPNAITTADELIRMMLDKFYSAVGPDRMNVPAARGMTFYQIVTLASIVQHETALPKEKPLVAGVYQNRLDGLHGFAPLMGSEPTVIWAVDTAKLALIPIEQWKTYYFWANIKTRIVDVQVPAALQGYQTYQVTGLIPGPLSTPATDDIDAALHPNQTAGYLYFIAIPNGTNVYAKTLAEQNQNIVKYLP